MRHLTLRPSQLVPFLLMAGLSASLWLRSLPASDVVPAAASHEISVAQDEGAAHDCLPCQEL